MFEPHYLFTVSYRVIITIAVISVQLKAITDSILEILIKKETLLILPIYLFILQIVCVFQDGRPKLNEPE